MAAGGAPCWSLSGSKQARFDPFFERRLFSGGPAVAALGGLMQRGTAPDNLFGFQAEAEVLGAESGGSEAARRFH